jgi:hypothetical protein
LLFADHSCASTTSTCPCLRSTPFLNKKEVATQATTSLKQPIKIPHLLPHHGSVLG